LLTIENSAALSSVGDKSKLKYNNRAVLVTKCATLELFVFDMSKQRLPHLLTVDFICF